MRHGSQGLASCLKCPFESSAANLSTSWSRRRSFVVLQMLQSHPMQIGLPVGLEF